MAKRSQGGGEVRAGPYVPIVKSRQDPTAVSQGVRQPVGLAREGRRMWPGRIFFLGTSLVLALTFRTSLAWNSGVQL